MTYSYALEHSLRNGTFEENPGWYPSAEREPCYSDNNIFSKFLEITLPYDGECFIPVLGTFVTTNAIQEWFCSDSPMTCMKISYPLFVGGSDTKRTADAIIQSINRCNNNLRLSNIKTSKGLDYYGGNGIIFDEHWNPLMLCGFITRLDRARRELLIKKPVCYVSPKVFTNNDILSKAIIKKVIPILSMNGIYAPQTLRDRAHVTINFAEFGNVLIVVKDLDEYFKSPKPPIDIENLDDSIWNFLSDNIPDLV